MRPFEVTQDRLDVMLQRLARFSVGGDGVTRRVYDRAWQEAWHWLAGEARTLRLAATADAAGNLYVHPPSAVPGRLDRPVLLVGSHLDTVVRGGPLDGALGACAGILLAAEAMAWTGLPVVGFVTCEEEQSRFDACFIGARAMLGSLERAELESSRDEAGMTLGQGLTSARNAGCAAPLPAAGGFAPPFRAASMLELHIEQGPVLEAAGLSLGIVEHVAGYRRLRAHVIGEARHSGTTPMDRRRDAMAAAAAMVLEAEAAARAAGDAARATAGFARAMPGLHNVIAGEVELGLEVRHAERDALDALAADLARRCRTVAEARGVRVEIVEASRQEPQPLSRELVAVARDAALELGLEHRVMASGAAHDAMLFARAGVPSLMLFVPSVGGVSHAPEEHTEPAALFDGYRALRETARRIAEAGVPA